MTVKKSNSNVRQSLGTEVRNPGQNESQQMFALCDRVKKGSSPRESLDRGRKKIEAKWLARTLKRKWHVRAVSGNGVKENHFWNRCRSERSLMPSSGWRRVLKRDVIVNRCVESRAKLRAKHQNQDLRDSSRSDKIYWNYRRNHQGKMESILDKKTLCLQARAIYIYVRFRQPVKEKILSEGTRQKISKH